MRAEQRVDRYYSYIHIRQRLLFPLVVIFFLTFSAHSVFGAELLPEYGKGIMTLTDDFNGDGVKETVSLKALYLPDRNGLADFDLVVTSNKKTYLFKKALLEQSPALCGLVKVAFSAKKKHFIGVAYNCGAHSAGLDLYSFDGKSIKKVVEFGSDGPSIRLEDTDKDVENEVVTENRDWDHNPVGDRIIKTYKYDGKKWSLISVYETRTKI